MNLKNYEKSYAKMKGLREKVVKKTELKKKSEVLEVGFGGFFMTKVFAKDKRISEITAIDYCKNYLEEARKKFRNKKVSFEKENFFSFKPEKEFDAVFFFISVSDLCKNRKQLLETVKKTKNILKEDGLLVVSDNFLRKELNEKEKTGIELNKALGYGLFEFNDFLEVLEENGFKVQYSFTGPEGTRISEKEFPELVKSESECFQKETGKKNNQKKIIQKFRKQAKKGFLVDSRIKTVYARKMN